MNEPVLDADQIAGFLVENPEFLLEHPAVLAAVELRHDTEAASSLIEHQVAVLRRQVSELRNRLARYHDSATENEALFRRVHDLYLEMLSAPDVPALVSLVRERLRRDFDCDAVGLAWRGADAELEGVRALDPIEDAFATMLAAGEPVCGRLTTDRLTRIFDAETVQKLGSAAIVPWGRPANGLLVLGSSDEAKFHPGMGTLFLAFLGQMLGQRLAMVDAAPKARTEEGADD